MIGIIILIVTVVTFLGIGAWALVKILRGPDFPKGYKFSAVVGGKTATIIVDKDLPSIKNKISNETEAWIVDGKIMQAKDVAEKCAVAMIATETIFHNRKITKASRPHVIFLFKTNKNFEAGGDVGMWSDDNLKHVAAYSVELSGIFGTKRVDMVVIRTDYLSTIAEKGQPAVHELIHVLNKAATGDYSSDHTDPNLWLGPGGKTSIEGEATVKWTELVQTLTK